MYLEFINGPISVVINNLFYCVFKNSGTNFIILPSLIIPRNLNMVLICGIPGIRD